jgi:hypothetical protein
MARRNTALLTEEAMEAASSTAYQVLEGTLERRQRGQVLPNVKVVARVEGLSTPS